LETRVLHWAASRVASRLQTPPWILRIDRPAAERLSIRIQDPDGSRSCLVVDVHPRHGTLHLAAAEREPDGGALFWDRLAGARLAELRPDSDPRIYRLILAAPRGPLTDVRWQLVFSWTGSAGNIRLLDEGDRIIDLLRRGGPQAGEIFRPPPPDPRPGPEALDLDTLLLWLREAPAGMFAEALSRKAAGLSPAVAASIVQRARMAHADPLEPVPAQAFDPAAGPELAAEVLRLLQASEREAGARTDPLFYMLPPLGPAHPPAVVTFHRLPEYEQWMDAGDRQGSGPALQKMDLVHRAWLRRETEERFMSGAHRTIAAHLRRLDRLRDNLQAEDADGGGPFLRVAGEAILNHIHALQRGDRELFCEDWRSPSAGALRIPLDPAKTPADNAQAYFRRARRWERGAPHREKRLHSIESAAERLRSLAQDIPRLAAEASPEEFDAQADRIVAACRSGRRPAGRDHGIDGKARDRSPDAGTAPSLRPGAGRPERPGSGTPGRAGGAGRGASDFKGARNRGSSEIRGRGSSEGGGSFRPREFRTTDGWLVLVGRSNQENDHLTHRMSHPEDYWLHVHGAAGSHVILRREGRKENPSGKTLAEAASIAAYFSKARHSGKVPVIYTLRKYVRKPRGAKPGLAMCTREKTILVHPRNPDPGKEPEWADD